MYFLQGEHNPQYIHAIYNDDVVAVDFITGKVLEGFLPPGPMRMVQKWILIHKDALHEMWKTQEFRKLPPLR